MKITRFKPFALVTALTLAFALHGMAHAASVSVNFGINLNDANAVDADETSVVGNPHALNISGVYWNNILLQSTATAGSPTTFIANTTGGNHINLNDDAGNHVADLTSTIGSGGGYSQFAGVSTPNQAATGDAGLFQSFLNFGASVPSETLVVSNLASEFTADKYEVILFYDIGGNGPRTYGHTVSDGIVSQTFWTLDTNTDSDTNNDGVITWVQATGSTSATAVTDANYAVFTGLTASSFTISGVSTGGRTILSGLQIVAIPSPAALPAGLGLLSLMTLRRRRRA